MLGGVDAETDHDNAHPAERSYDIVGHERRREDQKDRGKRQNRLGLRDRTKGERPHVEPERRGQQAGVQGDVEPEAGVRADEPEVQ